MVAPTPDPATPPAKHSTSLPLLTASSGGDTPDWGSDAVGPASGAGRSTAGHGSGQLPEADDYLAPVWADGIVLSVPIDRVVSSRYRARHPSTARSLAPLVESLRTPGRILPPCPAVVLDDGYTFELLDGHRIIEVGRALGWEEATLLLVSVTDAQAALWTILSDSHRRRYTWWDKVKAMRILVTIAPDSMTGRAISRLSGWPESTVSESRTAAAALTPDVLVLAGVDEVRDRDRLMRLRRRDGRYIVRGGPPEEIGVRLREALDGRTPDALVEAEARERAAGAISSALHSDGRWRVEVDLAGFTGADLRALRRELVRQFDDACAKGRRAPAEPNAAPVKPVTAPRGPATTAATQDRRAMVINESPAPAPTRDTAGSAISRDLESGLESPQPDHPSTTNRIS